MSQPPVELQTLRRQIDDIDRSILALIEERRRCSNQVGVVKRTCGIPSLRDAAREYEILSRLSREGLGKDIPPSLTQAVFGALIKDSLNRQEQDVLRSSSDGRSISFARVGFLARDGFWGEQAAAQCVALNPDSPSPEPLPSLSRWHSLTEGNAALGKGEADVLVLPIEHSTLGTLRESVYALVEGGLSVVHEMRVPVSLCLIAPQGTPLNHIKRLYGPELAFRLCSSLLETLGPVNQEIAPFPSAIITSQLGASTADWAMLAPEYFAFEHGLNVLASSVSDSPMTFLRFLACTTEPLPYSQKLSYATSLLAASTQNSGALSSILDTFRQHNIVLTKIESLGPEFQRRLMEGGLYPNKGTELIPPLDSSTLSPSTDEFFFIECLGTCSEPPLADALSALRSQGGLIRVFGSYPRSSVPPEPGLLTPA
jgi:chorismate mutase / prephenate dehydratase